MRRSAEGSPPGLPGRTRAPDAPDVARDELIGLDVTVVASRHPPFVGTRGRVVDETARTLVVATGGREVVVPKRGQRFAFETASGRIEVEGAAIAVRPEERVKFKFKRKR